MNRRSLFFIIGVISLTSTISAQLPKELDTYIEDARVKSGTPGVAIAVVKDGKVLATKGYGVRTLGRPELVDENTVFDTASLTKSFTAAVIATLVDEGKMRWDDPVRRHLPQVEFVDPYRTASVTIRDLLSHRVGVEQGNFIFRFTNYDTAEVLRRMRFLEERSPFRTSMIYSNIGYAAAAEAAAAAAKTPFLELVRTRLLAPLGMRDSTAGTDHTLAANHASSHGLVDGAHVPIRTNKIASIHGANAVNSTARDMATWLLFHLGDGTWNVNGQSKRIVSAEAMNEMHAPQNIIPTTAEMRAARGVHFFAAYALGWQVMDFRGHKMLWHSGSADGMPVYMCILPDDAIGVLVMTNSWEAGTLHGALAARIMDTLLGNPLKDTAAEALEAQRRASQSGPEPARTPGTKPTAPLDAYAGTYADTPHGDMVVTYAGGKLTLQFGGGEKADLEHWHHDVFRVRWQDRVNGWADTFAAFALDATGKPRRFEMPLGRDVIEATR
jgi:CubicO group peptidase (beta-lactamase class C family)